MHPFKITGNPISAYCALNCLARTSTVYLLSYSGSAVCPGTYVESNAASCVNSIFLLSLSSSVLRAEFEASSAVKGSEGLEAAIRRSGQRNRKSWTVQWATSPLLGASARNAASAQRSRLQSRDRASKEGIRRCTSLGSHGGSPPTPLSAEAHAAFAIACLLHRAAPGNEMTTPVQSSEHRCLEWKV